MPTDSTPDANETSVVPAAPTVLVTYDHAISYAFQQNAIPIVKELILRNDAVPRKAVTIRVETEPDFAASVEINLQSLSAGEQFRVAPLDLKLSPDFLAGLNEKLAGWLRVVVITEGTVICEVTEPIILLARNEWCGLVSLPEILAAFVLPNDPAIMPLLSRASEILGEHTGRTALNGYQDKNRKRAWEQVAAIYKAVADLAIRYINPPASFENSGQKVRFPSVICEQRFGTCLDLVLLFAACCEQVGLHPLILMHEGHAYAGCWLDERTLEEPAIDDLQRIRKLVELESISVFEATTITNERVGTLRDGERTARAYLDTSLPFRIALDIRRARISRIHPMPIFGADNPIASSSKGPGVAHQDTGLGEREFAAPVEPQPKQPPRPASRIDQWKSKLLDLSLRNRLLNFKPTNSTIPILSSTPEQVEDQLAADAELSVQPKPKAMGEGDPRSSTTYTQQQKVDWLKAHLLDELRQGRLRTGLDEPEHTPRLTELYRAARLAVEENGTNTLYAAVGMLEWRETEHSDRVLRAPLLLVPVELKRRSVLEGFALRRLDEETRLNVTLMEMLRQHFRKEVSGLDPLPEDGSGVNVGLVFQIFREAVRDLPGWEVKPDIWLGQFSFAKFLLWKDLTDRIDALSQNRIVHHLLFEADLPYQNSSEDIRPPQLDQQFHPRDIYCPRSADSSQLAAVMAAAAGHDFVLEGPPGTGKSQTITNIIAHCLAHGKRVLFVAEKRAALDVVHRRLKEDGLEAFCLELHSNKSGKSNVLAQFDQSLKFMPDPATSDWERKAVELEGIRARLNNYVSTLHNRYPCGLSAFDCLDYLLPRREQETLRLDHWWDIRQLPHADVERARQLVQRLHERSCLLGGIAGHALDLVRRDQWSPGWAEGRFAELRELAALTRALKDSSDALRKWLCCPRPTDSLSELKSYVALVEVLLLSEPVGPAFALIPWSQLSGNLHAWMGFVQRRDKLRTSLSDLLDDSGIPCRVEAWSVDRFDCIEARVRRVRELSRMASGAAASLGTWLLWGRPLSSRPEIEAAIVLLDSLLDPEPVGPRFVATPWNDLSRMLDRWIELIGEREQLRVQLAIYNEPKLLGLDLFGIRRQCGIANEAHLPFKWLRMALVRSRIRGTHRGFPSPVDAKIGEDVEAAIRLREINELIASDTAEGSGCLGSLWSRSEPKLERLVRARAWGEKLHVRLAACAAWGEEGWLNGFAKTVGEMLSSGVEAFAPQTDLGSMLRESCKTLATFEAEFGELAQDISIRRISIDSAADYIRGVDSALSTLLSGIQGIRSGKTELESIASAAEDCLGSIWASGEPSTDALSRVCNWGATLHSRMSSCAGSDCEWLARIREVIAKSFSADQRDWAPGSECRKRLERFQIGLAGFEQSIERLVAELDLRRDSLDGSSDYIGSILALTERLMTGWPQLRLWCLWRSARGEGLGMGLSPIIEILETAESAPPDLPELFERSFRRSLLNRIIEHESVLRDFLGHEHAQEVKRFDELDQHLALLARWIIRLRLASKIPRDQVRDEIPKEELGLLRREIGKRARHMPVRQLLSRIPRLLPRLKPCVLMSPLSVAQYLEASHEAFDVVIFDEASQIPVWDSVGAIARGRQLIVVGDPKQLPPTNFFNRSEDNDDETLVEHEDLESILDELLSHGLRHKRLRWHYRSRHEGLITFSNRHYYENDLLTFPSPDIGAGGIKFIHLPDARYDKGRSRTNLGEARALVSDLVSRLRSESTVPRSFGVVTFSQAQQRLIENLLDEERRAHPELEIHFGETPPVVGEPLFVKNLENVQGDERDVILFSICYGPDETGRVSVNFGPLNRKGGERRLNVAITRAKHEVVVFSGLRGDQIDLKRTRARGVQDLKYFLEYAERGPKALISSVVSPTGEEPDSEFERLVADQIRAAGYEVHHQVGCSGYRIDLGVVDPMLPGRYLVGVECDGATYHRAATARDRDKLRQLVLEDLGWTIHRIWSTDWWHDRETQMRRLLEKLSELRERGE